MQRRNFLTTLLTSLGFFVPSSALSANRFSTSTSIEHQDLPVYLQEWLRQAMRPLNFLDDIPHAERKHAAPILQALHTGQALSIRYLKGSTPGQIRTITPTLLFHKIDDNRNPTGAIYLLAHCHLRQQSRNFRLDAIAFHPNL